MTSIERELLEIGLRPGGLHVHPQCGRAVEDYQADIGFLASKRWLEPAHNHGYTYWRTTPIGRSALNET